METIINRMSKDVLACVLNNLDITNRIPAALAKNPCNEIKRMTDLIHSVFCDLDHECGECAYYHEDQFDTGWSQPHHTLWLSATTNAMFSCDIANEKELLDAINESGQFLMAKTQAGQRLEKLMAILGH